MRSQFTHCIDIGPTILEAAAIPAATVVDGIEQKPMDGTSFLHTFDDPTRGRAPHAAVLRDLRQPGDVQRRLVARRSMLDRIPWDITPERSAGSRPESTTRQRRRGALLPARRLHAGPQHRRRTPGQTRRAQGPVLGGGREVQGPARCSAASAFFFGILPPMPDHTKSTFYGDVQNVVSGMIPRVYGHSYAITAELLIPTEGAEGVIVANADEMGGFSLVRPGRQAQAHLLDDGRRDLPAGVRTSRCRPAT